MRPYHQVIFEILIGGGVERRLGRRAGGARVADQRLREVNQVHFKQFILQSIFPETFPIMLFALNVTVGIFGQSFNCTFLCRYWSKPKFFQAL